MKTDVLIIGGGVIGVCTALYVARVGREVTLVEKEEIGSGASHGNAGWIAVTHAVPPAAPGVIGQGLRWLMDSGSPFYIKPRPDFDLARWLWAFRRAATRERMVAGTRLMLELNRRSLALYEALQAEGLAFNFGRDGIVHLHLSENARRAGLEELAFLEQFGIEGTLLERAALLERQPGLKPGVGSGIYYPEPGHVRPDHFIRVVSKKGVEEGVRIQTGAAVTDFSVERGRIAVVHTTTGTFEPEEVVLAAGAWSGLLAKKLGIDLLIQPAKGYSATAKRPAAAVGPIMPLAIDDYKIAVTPFGDQFRFSSTLELAGFDPSINRRRLATNFRGLNAILPGLESLSIEEVWAGYRPLMADGLPIIGRSEKIENLIIAAGHGTLGVTQGPATGELVAEIVGGGKKKQDYTNLTN